MDEAILNRVRRVVADVLGVPESAVAPASSPDTLERWDSVNHLSIVLALEQEFGVQFEPEQIEQMLSVELIAMTVQEVIQSAGR